MLTRTVLALLLLLPTTVSAQDIDTALSALVRISGTRGGTPVRGSGFVVALDGDKATIVTASHVIEGVQQLEVTFAVEPTKPFPAEVLGMDVGNQNGLAALQVRGALPAEVAVLSFEIESKPHIGDELFLLGFPQMALRPEAPTRRVKRIEGLLLLIDQGVGEGFSGGPALQAGRVVGVVTNTDDQTTYAVNARVAREALEGWEVKLKLAAKPEPPPTKICSGEERTEADIVFVRACAGNFIMGSSTAHADITETPAHAVRLSEFWIGKTEITNEQYRHFRPDHRGEASLPATDVRWADAKAACEFFGGHLPTEAEWEYAARAGSQTAWSFGDDEKMLDEYAWYKKNSSGTPHPVGTKKPNAWGIHDMHGNAKEWVDDWYVDYTKSAQTDPLGPQSGEERPLRGGSFYDEARDLRSARRFLTNSTSRSWSVGFRCVLAQRRQP